MLGTAVNTLAVIVGGALGLLIKGRLAERLNKTVMQGLALAVLMIGLSGALKAISDGASTLVFIVSLSLGGLVGAAVNINKRFNTFAAFIERRLSKNSGLSKGFIAGSILYCVGTMAVVGSIESGIMGKHDILFAKSMLDGISSIIFGATLGPGIILSALSVLFYQGSITLVSGFVAPYITNDCLVQISAVGGVLIFAIGLNMLRITKIKLANFLPAIFIPVIYYTGLELFSSHL